MENEFKNEFLQSEFYEVYDFGTKGQQIILTPRYLTGLACHLVEHIQGQQEFDFSKRIFRSPLL